MNETDLLHAFRTAVPFALPDVRIYRRNIINARSDKGVRLRNGIKGQADAYAIVRGGLHVEIETKAARGVLSDEQKAWRDYCLAFDIPYLMPKAKADETPEQTVARWVEELREVIRARRV